MKLTETQKRELLEEGNSTERRNDFRKMVEYSKNKLSPIEYLMYLTNYSETFPFENDLKPIKEREFLL